MFKKLIFRVIKQLMICFNKKISLSKVRFIHEVISFVDRFPEIGDLEKCLAQISENSGRDAKRRKVMLSEYTCPEKCSKLDESALLIVNQDGSARHIDLAKLPELRGIGGVQVIALPTHSEYKLPVDESKTLTFYLRKLMFNHEYELDNCIPDIIRDYNIDSIHSKIVGKTVSLLREKLLDSLCYRDLFIVVNSYLTREEGVFSDSFPTMTVSAWRGIKMIDVTKFDKSHDGSLVVVLETQDNKTKKPKTFAYPGLISFENNWILHDRNKPASAREYLQSPYVNVISMSEFKKVLNKWRTIILKSEV